VIEDLEDSHRTPKRIAEALADAAHAAMQAGAKKDDVTVVAIQVRKPAPSEGTASRRV
jgi:hypothetical protein